MKEIDEETARKIQEMQVLEQNLQNILLQKQAFNIEMNETINALEELKKTKDEVYKIVGQIMIKTNKKDMETELEKRKELIKLRIKALEKQENFLKEQLDKKREEIIKKTS
jgi:prefoldin beta subunit